MYDMVIYFAKFGFERRGKEGAMRVRADIYINVFLLAENWLVMQYISNMGKRLPTAIPRVAHVFKRTILKVLEMTRSMFQS